MIMGRSSKPKRHLVAAIDDVELYRVVDDFGCQWIRVHAGIETCMGERAARSFFAQARRLGEVFDLETELDVSLEPQEDLDEGLDEGAS